MIKIGTIGLERVTVEGQYEHEFRSLVDSHRDRAVRLAWRLIGGDQAAAEDIVQDAFCKVYGSLHKFREEATVSTYFYRTLIRQASQYRRWRAVRDRWKGLWSDEIPHPAPGAQRDPGLQKRIIQALSRLSHGQRQVFVLIYLEGFTVTETSALLKKSVGTVKSHLHRALSYLRRELEDLKP